MCPQVAPNSNRKRIQPALHQVKRGRRISAAALDRLSHRCSQFLVCTVAANCCILYCSLTSSSQIVLSGTRLLPVCYGLAVTTGLHRTRKYAYDVLVGGVSCAEWTKKGKVLRLSPVLTHSPCQSLSLVSFQGSHRAKCTSYCSLQGVHAAAALLG